MDICLQEYEEIIKRLINLEYPSQKRYPGIIQDIYKLAERIGRGETIDEVSFFSLARRFVDETMDYKSDILVVLKQLEKELKKENERKEKAL
ncbi:hypothetical protein O3652_01155 [Streptococcus sp. 27098_8_23]|jgi:hypothetical protein|uniref:Uncharacterized protein n=1 Tax=Streptococcus oralis TaxID=1303 RepID=A0A3R9HNR1_STROR|nr:hypothetical protein [Streptococcus oralis]RSI69996.1 hypothetical protein D8860_08005 [Streptococcus oralis]